MQANHPQAPAPAPLPGLLGLPGLPEPSQYRLVEQREEAYCHVLVAQSLDLPKICPHCQHDKLGSWGYNDQVFKDLPHAGKHVEIHLSTKRLRCAKCKKTFSQALPGMSEHRLMTQRLAHWIGEQGLQRTFVSIAEDIGVTEGTIRNAFADFVCAMEEAVQIETPQWLSLLEVSVLNKQRLLVLNSQAHTVVDLLFGTNKVIVGKYLSRLNAPERVQLVGMNFSQVCRDAVHGFLPRASVFIDRPYVLALADQGMLSARAAVRMHLSPVEQRALGMLWPMLVLRPSQLQLRSIKEQTAVQNMWERYPTLQKVSFYREAVHALYDAPKAPAAGLTPTDVEERLAAAFGHLEPGEQKHFSALQEALVQWRPQILNYFKYEGARASISTMGDLSNLDAQIERVGRSYVFEALRCKMLFPGKIPEQHYRSPGMQMHTLRAN